MVYGTWKSFAIKEPVGTWKDVIYTGYAGLWLPVKFNAGGTYCSDGYFVTVTGTHKAEKNIIYTYAGGKE